MRTRPLASFRFIILGSAAAALLAASCAREVEWPSATEEDVNETIYLCAEAPGGPAVVAVSASRGVRELGLGCDGQSEIVLSPDGRLLYYGLDGALHAYELASGSDRVLASFPGGVARERGTDDKGRERTYVWRCGRRFRDLTFGPAGKIAFVVEPTETPLAEEEAGGEGEEAELRPRSDFHVEAGAYVLEPGGGPPRYLGPTRAIYGYPDEVAILLENKLTLGRYAFPEGIVTPLLPPDAHELGWVPPAVMVGAKVAVVCPKAAEKSDRDILNDVYMIKSQPSKKAPTPLVSIRFPAPATRVAASPDGRYLAVECTPRVFGEPTIFVVDLERRRYKTLREGGRLLGFSRGSTAVYYVVGSGRTGDLFLAGLDGEAKRLTSAGKVSPAP